MLPQAPAGQRYGRLRRPSKRQGQALRALRGLAFSPARLRPGLSPRMCSGAQSGPVGWWPCCAPSAPNGPPGFAPPAGGPFGRSRPVPLALRAEPGAGAVRPAGRPALRRGNCNAAREGQLSAPLKGGGARAAYWPLAGGGRGREGSNPPTGQPPLCAWLSPLCSPARRQGSSRAAKGCP